VSALDKVVSAHQRALSLTHEEQEEEAREAAAVVLAQAAATSVAEASRLILAGQPVPAQLILAANVALQGLELPPPDVALSDWVEHSALALAADGGTSQGEGETYADPGHQSDGKKRYPVTKGGKLSEERIRAAWSYINQGDNASAYSSADLAKIKNKIKAAGKQAGVQFDDDADDKKVAASSVMLAASGAPMLEAAALRHKPLHGLHEHMHLHAGDNHHGPSRRLEFAKSAQGAADILAHQHAPIWAAHHHPHMHHGDAEHGPDRGIIEDTRGRADSSW